MFLGFLFFFGPVFITALVDVLNSLQQNEIILKGKTKK